MGPFQLERPDRLRAIESTLRTNGIWDELQVITSTPVTNEQIASAHDLEFWQKIESNSPKYGLVKIDPNTFMNLATTEAARLAVGSVAQSVDSVLAKKFDRTFCAANPPGHHAEHNCSMVFLTTLRLLPITF